MSELQPLFLVLLGAAVSFLGVIYSLRRQASFFHLEIRIKDEVDAIKGARIRVQSIKELYFYDTEKNCKDEIISYNKWFFCAQPFLPREFNNKWAGLRESFVKLGQLRRKDKNEDDEKIIKLHEHINELIKKCFVIIDSKLQMETIEPESCRESIEAEETRTKK